MKYKLVKNKNNLPNFNICGLEIKESTIPGANLGVFTLKDINKGEIVEIAPFLRVPSNSCSNNILNDYVFTENENTYILVLGYGSMYNHSYDPNLSYEYYEKDYFAYRANSDIKKGSELFISYGGDYWSSRNKKCN